MNRLLICVSILSLGCGERDVVDAYTADATRYRAEAGTGVGDDPVIEALVDGATPDAPPVDMDADLPPNGSPDGATPRRDRGRPPPRPMDMSPPVVPDAAQPVDAAPAPAMWILVETINDYRASRGLDPVRFSPSLQRVAEVHAQDLADHFAGFEPGCNLHSWSESADWTGCCYTSDHAQARCMWNKPRELTAYPGDGYEISSGGVFDAESALRSWQGSDAHHDVIINAPPWNIPWRAVGGAIRGRYAVVWFGHEVDPAR